MDGTTEFTNQGGKAPSFDHNKTLLDLHQEGETPGRGPISLSEGGILVELARDDDSTCNQNGDSLRKTTESVQSMDDTTTAVDHQCAELQDGGILDLSSNAFPNFDKFESDFFGSPDRDLFLSSDGGERSRSYPPSPTAPRSSTSKTDELTGLTVLSLEGGMGGLKKGQTIPQLPSNWLAGLDISGKEFQTIRLQDPHRDEEDSGRGSKETNDDGQSDLGDSIMILSNEQQGGRESELNLKSPHQQETSVAELNMSPLLSDTSAVLGEDTSPLVPTDTESSDNFPFAVDLKNLASNPSIPSGSSGSNNASGNNVLLNVATISPVDVDESRMEDGKLVYVITTKDQSNGSLQKIQVTVDPKAIQSIPVESLSVNNDVQWLVEQTLEKGGGDADSNSESITQEEPQTYVFPILGGVTPDVVDPTPTNLKSLLTSNKSPKKKGKKKTSSDGSKTKNMWLKKNQPITVTVCSHPGCGMEFTSKSKFKAHTATHAEDRPYKCPYDDCEWSFPSSTKLHRHLASHDGIKPYTCLEKGCGKQFGSPYNLKTHQKCHHQPLVYCCVVQGCIQTFQSEKKLQIHLREHFAETRLKCPVPGCEETFMTPNARGSHLRRHGQESKVYRCEFEGCNKVFDKLSRLTYHTRSHTGERPFKCTYTGCQWAFTSLQKLKRHECRHTGRKDFCCPVEGCGKSFTRKEHLQAHEVFHRGELPFECKEPGCNARFSQRSSLSMHKKRHSAGKPIRERILFSCPLDDCNQSYSSKVGLKNHISKGHMDYLPFNAITSLQHAASSVLANQTDTPHSVAAMSPNTVSLLPNLKDADAVSETAQSTIQIQLQDAVQQLTQGSPLGGDQSAISLLSSISLPGSGSRVFQTNTSGSARTDFGGLSKKSPMFPLSSSDSLGQSKELDVIDSMDISPPTISSQPSSVVPTSFTLTSVSPLTLRDPATGAQFIQTQLLQDDPPDDSDMTFHLVPPASTSNQSSIHGVLPVSSILGDGDNCPVSTSTDFLTSEGSFEESTINLQDLE
ncbi:Zinc finger protein ZXDC [Holothuria leucospilota]|uniref:Zinc finger protein ZXDC n=1 Tax=Holothuria leucospilota TaxID=206669 RepID=A0A9Q1HLJ1_HOLLE|nr:Zinc finger protein ZXDC [Holothuria leucospilota]